MSALRVITPASATYTGGSGSITSDGWVSVSGATGVLVNSVFSSTYKNYMIRVAGRGQPGTLLMQLYNGATPTVSNYYSQDCLVSDATVSTASNSFTTSILAGWLGSPTATDTTDGSLVYLFSPFESTETAYRSITAYNYSEITMRDCSGGNINTTSFTGFSLFTGTGGTMSIRISVYGFVR